MAEASRLATSSGQGSLVHHGVCVIVVLLAGEYTLFGVVIRTNLGFHRLLPVALVTELPQDVCTRLCHLGIDIASPVQDDLGMLAEQPLVKAGGELV